MNQPVFMTLGVWGLLLTLGFSCKTPQPGSPTATADSGSNFDPTKPAVPGAAGKCWRQPFIKVVFNPVLDPGLEPKGVNADGDRQTALEEVVKQWNAVFESLQTRQRLDLTVVSDQAGPYAAMQNKTRDPCVDPIMPGKTIHPFDFQGAPTLVQGSTGGDPDELVNGGVNNVAGWIYAESDQPGGGNSSFVDTDVLGMAQTLGGPEGISQASFTYLTHYAPNRDGTCRRIPWDYDSLRFGPGAPVYDFYSVMLHEVGHNLGLGHHAPRTCNDPVSGARNVMQPQIFQGERFVVGSCELKAMQALYGAGGPCHLPDPAALPRGE